VANVEDIGPYVEPVRKSVTVRRTPAEAFAVFTGRFGAWWPVKKFSLHQAETETCVIEPHVGGAIYEVATNGERAPWGIVRVWEPGTRFVMSWHPGHDASEARRAKLGDPIHEVTQHVRQLVVHRGLEMFPGEVRVIRFRRVRQQIPSPVICRQ
jgi:hypothetical protein